MKKLVLTHLFLNLYILALIQPALPVIDYLVNYDYITTELCENKNKPILTCNGKCYLEKQVKQQLNLTHSDESLIPPKVDFEKFFTIKYKMFDYSLFKTTKKLNNPIFFNLLEDSILILSLFKPPRI